MRYVRQKVISQLMLCCFTSGLSCGLAAADDFLSQIEAESGKVETDAILNNGEIDSVNNEVIADKNEDNDKINRKAFEQMLDREYHGSYVFYMKLPQRSKEEIFQEYNKGASIAKIRKKIIDRFMKR